MSFPARNLWTILIAILVGLGLLIGAFFLFIQLQTTPDLASYVPADRTIGFIRHALPDDRTKLEREFPALTQVPAIDVPMTVAILKRPDGGQDWIATFESPLPPDPSVSLQRLGKLLVATSMKDLAGLLPEGTNALKNDMMYRWLIRGLHPTALQVYSTVSTDGAHAGLISATLLRADARIMERTDDEIRFRSYLPERSISLRSFSAPLLRAPASSTKMSLALAGDETYEWMLSALPADRAAALRGLVQSRITAILGNDVSVAYDLQPLLSQGMILHEGIATGTGTAPLLLEGIMAPGTNVQARIKKLLSHIHPGGAITTIDRRTFADKKDVYESAIIRSQQPTPERDEEEEKELNDWMVRSLGTTQDGSSVWLASMGRRFVLSTDRVWLDDWLTPAAATTPALDILGTQVAAGTIDVSLLPLLAPPTDPLPGQAFLTEFAQKTPKMAWGLAIEGHIAEWTVRSESKPMERPAAAK